MHRVKHVVVLMLENRSFFNLLGDMKGVLGSTRDSCGPYFNCDSKGKRYEQTPVTNDTLCASRSFPNDAEATRKSLKHKSAGFVRAFEHSYETLPKEAHLDFDPEHAGVHVDEHPVGEISFGEPMTYFEFGYLPAIHTLAKHFVVCESWFSSFAGSTWPNRLFALSGTTNGLVDMPGAPGDFKVADLLMNKQDTIFSLLEEKRVSYRIYYDDAPLTLLLSKNWDDDILEQHRDMKEFYRDTKGCADDFPAFSWIEPRYSGAANDGHNPHNPHNTDHLVGSVYNALRANKELWNSTLFIVTFDEHGGFFDPVKPPKIPECAWEKPEFNKRCFKRYGVRVPTILISPLFKDFGVIDTTLYDHTSVLASVCRLWDLDPCRLGQRTRHANQFWHLFESNTSAACHDERPQLPRCVHLLPYDHTIRSGTKSFWNDFQCEMAGALKAMLQLHVHVQKGWDKLTDYLPDTSDFAEFIGIFNDECKHLHEENGKKKRNKTKHCIIM